VIYSVALVAGCPRLPFCLPGGFRSSSPAVGLPGARSRHRAGPGWNSVHGRPDYTYVPLIGLFIICLGLAETGMSRHVPKNIDCGFDRNGFSLSAPCEPEPLS